MLKEIINNSPIYLIGILIILIIVYFLKNSFLKLIKNINKKLKKRKEKQIISKIEKEKIKLIKIPVISWSQTIFFIVSIGIGIYFFFTQIDWIAEKIIFMYDFIQTYLRNDTISIILLGIFFSSIFVIISAIFESIQKRNKKIFKIISLLGLSIFLPLTLFTFIRTIEILSINKLNIILFSLTIILLGILVNLNKFFKKN